MGEDGRLSWDPAWLTGIEVIDEQHRKLFEQMESILNAVRSGEAQERIPGLLAFLMMYADVHFRDEEKAMSDVRYPGLARHRAIHNDMRHQVAEMSVRFQEDPSELTPAVLRFLSDWLVNHIAVEDRRLAAYLAQAQGR